MKIRRDIKQEMEQIGAEDEIPTVINFIEDIFIEVHNVEEPQLNAKLDAIDKLDLE